MTTKTITYLTGMLIAAQMTAGQTAQAGQTWHNVPGVACGAYNNTQANSLIRNHVRIFLPDSARSPLWVVCPIQRVDEDMASSEYAPFGYVNAYFSEQTAVDTEVACMIRHFNYDTLNIVGSQDYMMEPVQTVVMAKWLEQGDAQAVDGYFSLTDNTANGYQYYTIACKLEPGTGINSIDMYQQ